MTSDSLIFLSLEDWDDIWRRNQFVCATLARRHPKMKILFVGIPRHGPHLLRRLRFGELLSSATAALADFPNITVTRPLRLGIDSTESGHRYNQRLYRNHILKWSRRLGLNNPILWINPHTAYHVPDHVPHAAVIYDITDDWTTLSQKELDRVRTIDADRKLCQSADAVIVCSEKLHQLKQPLVNPSRLHLIPNGVDAAHYAAVLSPGPIPDNLARLPGPIFGYTGTIHPDRVDVPMLQELARRIPGSIALVGPSHLPDALQQKLAAESPNIHVLPAVPYARIPDSMRAFDVCITPHRMTPFTESLNPIKLWEYLAAGKPIVSTDVAGFRDYPQHVRIARTADEFAEALRGALAESHSPEGPANAQQRQAEARRHSWDSRVDQIESILQSQINHKPPTTNN